MRKRKVLWPIFSFLILLAVMLTIISFTVSKTDFVETKVTALFKNIIESSLNVTVTIGETEGNIFKGYTFYDITLFAQDTIVVGKAKYIALTFSLQELLGKQRIIRRIQMHEPSFDFTSIPPHALFPEKETTPEEKTAQKEETGKEKDESSLSLESISIVKGNLQLLYRGRKYSIENLSLEGRIDIASLRNRLIIEKCSADMPGITTIRDLSGSIVFKDGIVTLLDCVCKTDHSSISASGNLFDSNDEARFIIHRVSLAEIARVLRMSEQEISGFASGGATIAGKDKTLRASASLSLANLHYGEDSLGTSQATFVYKDNRITISQLTWDLPDGRLSLEGSYDLKTEDFVLSTEMDNLVLDRAVSHIMKRDIAGRLSGTLKAHGKHAFDPSAREMDLTATLHASRIQNFAFDSLNGHITSAGEGLSIDHLSLASKGGIIQVEGVWGAKKDISFEANNFMVAPLLELAGINDINGVLRMKGRFTEREGKPSIQAAIDCYEPHVKNIKANHLSADINYNTADNYSSIMVRDLDLFKTRIDSLAVAFLTDSIIRTFSLLAHGEDIRLNSLVNIEQEGEQLAFLIDTLDLKYKEAKIANREQLRIEMPTKDRFSLKGAHLYFINIPVLLDLELDKALNYRLQLNSDSLDLRIIAELMELNKDLGGALGIEIQGNGSLHDPRLTMHLSVSDFFLEDMRADNLAGEFTYRDEKIIIESFRIVRGEEISEIEGTLPITIFQKQKDPSKQLQLTITANDLGSWIFYPFDRFAHFEGGKVYGTMQITGTVGKLDMTGDLRIYSSNIYIPFLGIRMKETDGYLELSEEEIIIQDIKAIVDDGFIDLEGSINLRGIKPQSIDLSIAGRHIPITGFKDIFITVSPELKLSGPFNKLLLEGFVAIEKGDITIPFRRKIERGIRRGGTFSYDVEISADEGNIWLKNEDVDVELAGNIFAKGTGSTPQLSGTFETKRGSIFYLDNTFTIERGVFRFMNSPELNPEIDLKAETKVRYTPMKANGGDTRDTTVTVYLSVGGTMQQPKFSLTASDPSFNEENIILLLSLSVTSLEQITSIENMSTLSDKAANFWIRQMLMREFQSTLGVDAIDLETRLLGSEKSAKLTVGKYVSKDLYLGVTHDIFATSKDEFEIEYRVWKGSYLIGKRNEEGRYNLGVRFKFKY